jgi:hypothetical protein
MSTTTVPARTASNAGRRGRGLAVAASVAVALAAWTVAGPLAGVRLAVRAGSDTRQIGPVPVIVASLLAGLAGWALLAMLERVGRRPRGLWTAIAVVALVLSLAGPLGGVTTAAKVALACMHVATAGALIPLLARTAGRGKG